MSSVTDQETDLLEQGQQTLQMALSAGADEAEVAIAHGAGSDVEFEKNDIQVALSSEESIIGVRVFKGGRCGFASTNDVDALRSIVNDALSVASASEPHDANGLPESQVPTPIEGLYDESTSLLGVGEVTDMGAALLEAVRVRDPRVMIDSGGVGASTTTRALVNSLGLSLSESRTSVGASLFGMAVEDGTPGSFVVEGMGRTRLDGFDESLHAIANRFATKSIGALHPGQGKSFLGSVLLSPESVNSFVVSNLLTLMNAATIRKGKSLLKDRLGEVVASPLLSITDDATLPNRVTSSAFDREGVPKQRLPLIEEGVFQSVFYNHFEATVAEITTGSTGHAAGSVATVPSVGCNALEIAAGSTPLKDLLAAETPCILVERFSGSVNPVTGAFSGVVKGGYLLENGERRPVGETLIAGELLDLVQSIQAVSIERQDVFGRALTPWLLCDGISVTGG